MSRLKLDQIMNLEGNKISCARILPGKILTWQPPTQVVTSPSFHTDHDIPYLPVKTMTSIKM